MWGVLVALIGFLTGETVTPGFSDSFSYGNHGGTGDRRSFITVSGASTSAGDQTRWVDGSTTNSDSFSFKFNSGAASGQSFTLDFTTPHEINEWTMIFSISTALGVWKIEGSNDNASWTTLLASFTLGGATSVTVTPTLTGAYRYYRFSGVSGSTQTSTRMIEGQCSIRNS